MDAEKTLMSVKERIEKIGSGANAGDGIFLAIGISAFIVGILVDVFLLRLLCLVVVMVSGGLVFASMRAKHLRIHPGLRGADSPSNSQSESEIMKKLVFDDFQLHSQGGYHSEETFEQPAVPEHQPAAEVPAARLSPRLRTFMPVKSAATPIIREFQISDFFD